MDKLSWDRVQSNNNSNIQIDQNYEYNRGQLREQAQRWAGLQIMPEAELFVFVGRWSMQKGVSISTFSPIVVHYFEWSLTTAFERLTLSRTSSRGFSSGILKRRLFVLALW